ncbi:hypothetical protein [Burkholderia cenocepacia]|uniref:hypothetical protein n=1 Tax=Burkholderia cenocepacia TaxID=95486 RepID=UPI0022325E4E|nr:hypothetical protein [Burkholderia cenocepacia]MCW3503958.1 hypothetical protein [Burkholderia cenocepacia]MCW3511243.1 hypothetical protein [Burkholderia cenocepacia]MCW3519067.1 hypothetical protein [Burkholderia cenocepacia]MCW3534294.1 hypothetical protein [Burkholderia cenocepacia]MCW3549476.1 hypothetical protein [Burkholderia cenocepacia]
MLNEIQVGIEKSGGFSRRDGETDLLDVNGEFTVSLVIARCKVTPAGSYRWRVRLDTSLSPDITIVARMNHDNTKPYDFYLLPSIDFTPALLPYAEYNGFALDVYQFETLDMFYRITARLPLAEAI